MKITTLHNVTKKVVPTFLCKELLKLSQERLIISAMELDGMPYEEAIFFYHNLYQDVFYVADELSRSCSMFNITELDKNSQVLEITVSNYFAMLVAACEFDHQVNFGKDFITSNFNNPKYSDLILKLVIKFGKDCFETKMLQRCTHTFYIETEK